MVKSRATEPSPKQFLRLFISLSLPLGSFGDEHLSRPFFVSACSIIANLSLTVSTTDCGGRLRFDCARARSAPLSRKTTAGLNETSVWRCGRKAEGNFLEAKATAFLLRGKVFWKRKVSICRWRFHRQSWRESGRDFLQSASYFLNGMEFSKWQSFWTRKLPSDLIHNTEDFHYNYNWQFGVLHSVLCWMCSFYEEGPGFKSQWGHKRFSFFVTLTLFFIH